MGTKNEIIATLAALNAEIATINDELANMEGGNMRGATLDHLADLESRKGLFTRALRRAK